MKKLFWVIFILGTNLCAQDYVDLFRLGFGRTFENNFEGSDATTQASTIEADINLPIILSAKHAFLTGVAFGYGRLSLYPDTAPVSLFSTTLKLGLVSSFEGNWGTTFVFLPKIASDYQNITSDDFYMGLYALVKYKKSPHLIYRLGAYGSEEAFGFFATPIIGWYYLSPSKLFQMDVSLPISVDISYQVGKYTLGVDYFGIGRSFNFSDGEQLPRYLDFSSLEFAAYAQIGFINDSVLLRGKIGYSSNDFEVYAQGDNIDLGLSAFNFNDNRTQLNPDISGSVFFKFELLYRLHLTKNKPMQEIIE